MNILSILSILMILVINTSNANSIILMQGETDVNFKDLDGFAFRMPVDRRAGFFQSTDRIDKTLTTLLKMKHIINYANKNNLLDADVISKKVQLRVLSYYPQDKHSRPMEKEIEYQKVLHFLTLEESYKYFKQNFLNSVDKEDVLELAEEKYLINKSSYKKQELKDLDYISIIYNESNKEAQLIKANKILADIINIKDKNFSNYVTENLKNSTDVEIKLSILGFIYDKKYKKFSDFIFKNNKLGVIDELLDYNSRFNIINITNYHPQETQSFEQVKSGIIKSLINKRAHRKFSNLLLSLTKDPIEIDKQIFTEIKSRYKSLTVNQTTNL